MFGNLSSMNLRSYIITYLEKPVKGLRLDFLGF